MEKGEIYTTKTIEAFADIYGYSFEYLGECEVGADFVILTDDNKDVVSFVMVEDGEEENKYECVFCNENL
jgi:hypothetical protein